MPYQYDYDDSYEVNPGRYNPGTYHNIRYAGHSNERDASGRYPDSDFLHFHLITNNDSVSAANNYRDGAVYGPYVSGDEIPTFWAHNPDYVDIQSSVRNCALSKFISRVQGSSNANIPLMLADIRQTSGMLASRGLQLAAILNALRRGKIAKALRLLDIDDPSLRRKLIRLERRYRRDGLSPSKKASNHWLELQFGMLPLISDIFNLIEIFEKQVLSTPEVIVAQSTCSMTVHTENPGGIPCSGWNSPGATRYWFEADTTIRYGFSGRYVVSDPKILLLKSLGLTNPLYVIYDLIPLSFVAGWFTNISSYLKQFDYDEGLTAVNLSQSFRLSEKGRGKRYKYGWWCLNGNHSAEYFQRTANPNMDLTLTANLFDLFDLWKATTAMALVSQRSK